MIFLVYISCPLAHARDRRFVHDVHMNLTGTILGLGASAGLLVVAVVLDRRPYRPGKLNYIPLMIICLAVCLVLGRHLLTLIR
jgi:hypothetical protein